jgi:hypothetical protein
MRALALCALGLALAACAARSPGRALYQWSDEQGNVRYTTSPDEVPRAARHTLARIEPGRSAEANALLSPGARTEPRSAPSATEWLRGEAPAEPGAGTEAAAGATGSAPATPATPEEIAALDAAIRALETEIAAAEIALADQIGGAEQGAGVREASERLPRLQAELLALRERRAAVAPDDGG